MKFPQNFSSELARYMDPALVTVLSEHLGQVAEHPEYFPHSENISQSPVAWFMASDGFAELSKEFANRLDEWQAKWQKRFEIEGTAQVVACEAAQIKKTENAKEKERLSKNLYLSTAHLMVGDAQRHVVTLNSRAELLQEKVRKMWHKSCLGDSYSKILPSMENAFQGYEETYFGGIREYLPRYATQEFASAIMAKENCESILNFYFSNIFRYVSKISYGLCRFYSKKWALYANGFRSRQNSLPLG